MLKALFWKEFRDVLPLCAIALAVQVLLICYAIGIWTVEQHRNDVLAVWPFVYIAAVVFPIAMGLWQNWRESTQNTFQFLLHRPLKREKIFGTKIGLGLVFCLVVGLLPLACFTAWIEIAIKNARSNFPEVLQVLCSGIWLMYLGSFISSIRPARWFGSRFFPLLAGVALFIVAHPILEMTRRLSDVWHAVGLMVGPALTVAFVVAALHVAQTRDYS
jgi:uncharacterized membrane protein SirB2